MTGRVLHVPLGHVVTEEGVPLPAHDLALWRGVKPDARRLHSESGNSPHTQPFPLFLVKVNAFG